MPDKVKTFFDRLIHRPIPILLVGFYMYLMEETLDWFMAIKEPSSEQQWVTNIVVGGAVAYFKFYVDGDNSE